MNFSSTFGTIIISVVLFYGVIHSAKNPYLFLNPHALILVLGGTIGVTLLAYPFKKLKELMDFLIYGLFLKNKSEDLYIVADLIRISEEYKKDKQNFFINYSISNPFLKESSKLLSKISLSHDELLLILKNRRDSFKKRYVEDYKMLLAMSKFPPGLGLLGASSGMIEMMSGLNSSGMDGIGQAMAVALVATFWGIATANFVLLPLADYAQRIAQEDSFSRNLIIQGISLIKKEHSSKIVSESLISQLPIKDQIYLRTVFLKQASQNQIIESSGLTKPYDTKKTRQKSEKTEMPVSNENNTVIDLFPPKDDTSNSDLDKTAVISVLSETDNETTDSLFVKNKLGS